ncbi:MAG: hypothetical protein K6G30_07515 [Acetatifactor sp.]|nr:hypothetical protein [Acetatifactor sp.]
MPAFFRETLSACEGDLFFREVCRRYHYETTDFDRLKDVWKNLQKGIRKEAFWEHRIFLKEGVPMSQVVITLGEGVDSCQEKYTQVGELSEAYMVEVLTSELLLRAYQAYNLWVEEHTAYVVKRYHFLGSAGYPMEGLPDFLQQLSVSVSCTGGMCMQPKKSVAFYAELIEQKEAKQLKVTCPGICTGCENGDCPNRMREASRQWNFADMTDRPLPYGYQQIWGGKK